MGTQKWLPGAGSHLEITNTHFFYLEITTFSVWVMSLFFRHKVYIPGANEETLSEYRIVGCILF